MVKRALVFIVAAVAPFTAVWSMMTLMASDDSGQPVKNVENIAKYFQPQTSRSRRLVHAHVLWEATELNGTSMHAFAVVGDKAVMASDVAVTSVDLKTGNQVNLLRLDSHIPSIRRPYGATAGAADGTVWILAAGHVYGLHERVSHALELSESLEVSGLARSVHWLNRDELIATGPFEEGLLRRYRRAKAAWGGGDVLVRADSGSNRLFAGLARGIATPLNETAMAVRPEGDLIALAFRWSDRLRVHRRDSLRLVRSIAGPVETFSSFAVTDRQGLPTLTYNPDTAWTYVDVTADDDRIIALYSGRDRRRYGSRMAFGRELHVFSWDGRMLQRLTVDLDLRNVSVSHDGRTLFGLGRSEHDRPALVSVDLESNPANVTSVARDQGSPLPDRESGSQSFFVP